MMRRIAGPFVTGMVFLAPVFLTVILLQWVAGYVTAAFGPGTVIGGVLAQSGMLVTRSPLLAFWAGLGIAALIVWSIGLAVQTRWRDRLEGGLDGLLGRVPVLGGFYRPLAQIVRMIAPAPDGATGSAPNGGIGGELKGMSVVSVRFGPDHEMLALLATPQIFDLGEGPRHLVICPTAPVPVGGNMLFVAVAQVRSITGLGVDDLAKFYVSMGTITPGMLLAR